MVIWIPSGAVLGNGVTQQQRRERQHDDAAAQAPRQQCNDGAPTAPNSAVTVIAWPAAPSLMPRSVAIAVSRLIDRNSDITRPNTPSVSDAMAGQIEVSAAGLEGDCTGLPEQVEPLDEEDTKTPSRRREAIPSLATSHCQKRPGSKTAAFTTASPRDQKQLEDLLGNIAKLSRICKLFFVVFCAKCFQKTNLQTVEHKKCAVLERLVMSFHHMMYDLLCIQ